MENNYWKTAEQMNGRLAMMGLFAAVINYGFTGWIVPGIVQIEIIFLSSRCFEGFFYDGKKYLTYSIKYLKKYSFGLSKNMKGWIMKVFNIQCD